MPRTRRKMIGVLVGGGMVAVLAGLIPLRYLLSDEDGSRPLLVEPPSLEFRVPAEPAPPPPIRYQDPLAPPAPDRRVPQTRSVDEERAEQDEMVQELLRIRKLTGGVLDGSLLEKMPDAPTTHQQFRDAIQDLSTRDQDARVYPSLPPPTHPVAARPLPAPDAPIPAEGGPDLFQRLQHCALELEQCAHELERLPGEDSPSDQIRRLARRLRRISHQLE